MTSTNDIIPVDPVTGERDYEGVPRDRLPQAVPELPPWFIKRALWIARNSLTVFWGYFQIAAGLVLDALPAVAYFLNAPEVSALITTYAGPSSHLLKVGGIITVLVRLRTLGKGQVL